MTDVEPPSAAPDRAADLEQLLRRVIGARVWDPDTVDDLVQETLTRVLAVERRLDDNSLEAYAAVSAQNLVRSRARSEERRRQLLPRLFDPHVPQDPGERATEQEERRALAEALAQLPRADRDALIAHHVEGVATATIGRQLGSSARAVSVRLARARARLRVEYLLAWHPAQLPTSTCKPVLLALSSGDRRRQQALDAGEHLLSCPPCAELSQPLVHRRRPAVVAWPASALGAVVDTLRRQVRSHPLGSTAAAVAVVAAVVAASLIAGGDQPRPALIVDQDPPVALSGDKPLAPYQGRTVKADKVRVYSAPGPDGFWVGESASDRIWVDLESGDPLPFQVAPGQRLSFVGKVAANQPPVLHEDSVGGPPDKEQLSRQGFHVHIDEASLQVDGQPRPPRP